MSINGQIQSLLKVASSFSRLYEHTKDRNIGMLSAHRGEFTAAENEKRNKNLADEIRRAGYGFVRAKGRYVENYGRPDARNVDEHSYLVVGDKGHDGGKLRGHVTGWGQKYGQDSVLYKPHDSINASLIGTRDGAFPGLHKEHPLGAWHPNRTGEFHSVMRGRPFSFEQSAFVYVGERGFFSRGETVY